MAKNFKDLLNDVVFAGGEIARLSATQLVREIQDASPYWDGYFANEWVVRQGSPTIPATLKGVEPSNAPQSKDITYATVPEPKKEGTSFVYTIGNQMEYRIRALDIDIEPGRNAEGNQRNYVPKGWFETYTQGGEQLRVMQAATNRALRRLGFK
jgi:hypothetical protein